MKYIIAILISIYLLAFSYCASCQNNIDSLLQQINNTQADSEIVELKYSISKLYARTDLNKAFLFADEGLSLARKINDSLQIANGLFLSGSWCTELGMLDKAMENLVKAKNLYENLNKPLELSVVINGIGNVYWYNDDFSKAIDIYKDLFESSKKRNDSLSAIIYAGNIGLCYTDLANYDSSLFYFRKTLLMATLQNNSYNIGWSLNQLAYLNLLLYKHDSAAYYYHKALHHKANLPDRLKSYIYINLSKITLKNKQLNQTRLYIDSARYFANKSNSLLAKKSLCDVKFNYELAIGSLDSAIQTQLELSRIKDSIMSNDYNSKLSNYQSIYEVEKKETEIEKLMQENQIISLKSTQQKNLILFLVLISISFLVIVLLIFQSNKIKKNAINKLNQVNSDLIKYREELISINQELSDQRVELFNKNAELEETIEQLKNAQSMLIQSEKMASIGVLARGVAHELINPLNFVNGGIITLEDRLIEHPSIAKNFTEPLQMMYEGINRAVTIVKQLSSFVDHGTNKPQLGNVNAIIDSCLTFLNYKINIQTKLIKNFVNIEDSLCYPEKIHSIVFQLIANALDEVEKSLDEKIIKISTSLIESASKKNISIRVFNTGNPIPENIIPRLFDPFFTTKEPNKGSGMGLTIAYNLVTELEGNISVKNLENGVEFTVVIPLIES